MIQNFFKIFFRGLGSLSQSRLNIFTVDNMGVMICLGQGGLRSLSASSLVYIYTMVYLCDANVPADLIIAMDRTDVLLSKWVNS